MTTNTALTPAMLASHTHPTLDAGQICARVNMHDALVQALQACRDALEKWDRLPADQTKALRKQVAAALKQVQP